MKINSATKTLVAFTGLWNNKLLLNGLEKISEHGTSFSAGVSVVMATVVRPIAIFSTPDVEKENKQYAGANSICSGLLKFGIVASIAVPVENAVNHIGQNYKTLLSKQAQQKLQPIKSQSYALAAQMIKLSTGLLTAIPKSMLTIALIPIVMDKIFKNKKEIESAKFKKDLQKEVAFKGTATNRLAKRIGKIFENEHFQKFVIKHAAEEKNIAKHMSAATDVLLTGSFAYQTMKSNKIKENRKKALIYNTVISTAVTLLGGYAVDNIAKNKTNSFIKTFSKINERDPKLHKYLEGLNIVRPAIIFAAIYYCVLPIFSTYLAEKIDKFVEKKQKEN